MGGITLAGYASRLWTGRPTESSPASSQTTQKPGKGSRGSISLKPPTGPASQAKRDEIVKQIVKETSIKFRSEVLRSVDLQTAHPVDVDTACNAYEDKVRSQTELMLGNRPGEKEIAAAKAHLHATQSEEFPKALEWIGNQQQARSGAERERILSRLTPPPSSQKAADVNDAQSLQSAGKQRVEGRQLAQMASATQLERADLARKSFQPAPPPAPFFEAGLEQIDLPELYAPPPTPELDEDSDYLPPDDLPPPPNFESDGAGLNQTADGSAPPKKPLPAIPLNAAAPPPPGPPPTDILPPPDAPPALPNNPPAGHLNPPAPSDPPPPLPEAPQAPPRSAPQNAGVQPHAAAAPLNNPPAPAQTAAPGPGQVAAPAPQWKTTEPRAQSYKPRANRADAAAGTRVAPALPAQQRQKIRFVPRTMPPPGMQARAYYRQKGIVIGVHAAPRRGGLPAAAAAAAPPVANSAAAPAPAAAPMTDPAREQQRLYAQAIAKDMTHFALTQFNLGLKEALPPSVLEDEQLKTEIADDIRQLQGEVETRIEQLLMSRTPDQSSVSEPAAMELARELVEKRLASWRVKDSAASEVETIVTAATFGFERRLRDSAGLKGADPEMIKTLTGSFEAQLRKTVDEFLATSAVGINERSLDRAREKASEEVDDHLAPLSRPYAAQAAPGPQAP